MPISSYQLISPRQAVHLSSVFRVQSSIDVFLFERPIDPPFCMTNAVWWSIRPIPNMQMIQGQNQRYPYAPCIVQYYLQNWAICGVNVGIFFPAPWSIWDIQGCCLLHLAPCRWSRARFPGKQAASRWKQRVSNGFLLFQSKSIISSFQSGNPKP